MLVRIAGRNPRSDRVLKWCLHDQKITWRVKNSAGHHQGCPGSPAWSSMFASWFLSRICYRSPSICQSFSRTQSMSQKTNLYSPFSDSQAQPNFRFGLIPYSSSPTLWCPEKRTLRRRFSWWQKPAVLSPMFSPSRSSMYIMKWQGDFSLLQFIWWTFVRLIAYCIMLYSILFKKNVW